LILLSGRGNRVPAWAGAKQAKEASREQDRFRLANDPIAKLYRTARWLKFRAVMVSCNSICQRLVKNPLTGETEQCHSPSVVCHHIVSPRVRLDLFLESKNVICFCAVHHPPTEGSPQGWAEGVDYVPTVLPKYHIG